MIHFEWPWLALALPLPWLVHALLAPAADSARAALRVPLLDQFRPPQPAATGSRSRTRPGWPVLAALLAWLLLVLAATRPEWLGELVEVPVSGRDLMLAVDLSGSMQAEDFLLGGKPVDRLTATKAVAGNFIERRAGDRIGLILFGERAYLQAPLTFDRETVRTLLYESVIGLAGKATAIGDAIGLAVKRLRGEHADRRVLVLLTDGANTAGLVDPVEAADLAARAGLKIYTVGVGADEMLVREFFGMRRINPSAELDEAALRAIAERTGGRYFRARDTNELEQIYRLLDELEPVAGEARRYRPRRSLFHWPLAGATLLAAGLVLLRSRGRI